MASKPPLLGKTLDLSKAYKQVAVHPDCRKRAVLGFPVEPGKWHYFLSRSLPFGATSSVYAFNKIALALLHIMVVKFYAIATDFYDDYTVFDFQPCAALLDKVLMRLLTLLGWHFAREGKKFVPFASTVVSLGVSVDLSPIWKGAVEVANKNGRLEKISELLRSIAEGGETTRSHLASLHGLINFAGGYVLGFELKPTARMLAMSLSGPFRGATEDLRASCKLALSVIELSRPRAFIATVLPPIVLYTDGAYEGNKGSWGALVVDSHSGNRWLFDGSVPTVLLDHWRRHAGKQVICQVEAYAVAMILYGLRGTLRARSAVAHVDNDPCRYGFIKRSSPSSCVMALIALVSLLEGACETALWYERVPSKSNPADLPSKRLGSSSMFSGSDSRGRAQPWQKSTEPQALISTREKCCGRLKTAKSKNGKTQDTAKPALSKKVQDSEGCSSPYRTMIWSKEDWSFYTKQSKRKIRYLVRKHLKET